MTKLHILVAPRHEWVRSCLIVSITAWRDGHITSASLTDAVRLAVKRRLDTETVNGLLGEVGLEWNSSTDDLCRCA